VNKSFIKGFFWWAWNTEPNTVELMIIVLHHRWNLVEFVLRKYYGGNLY